MLEESSLAELEVIEGEESIRLSKSSNNEIYQDIVEQKPENLSNANILENKNNNKPAKEVSGHEIKSPMVGTFYEAPSPGSKPSITQGHR